MNILRRARAHRDISVIEKPLETFVKRVQLERLQNIKPSLECIDKLIDDNLAFLVKKFRLEPVYDQFELRQRIWDKLKRSKVSVDPKLVARNKHFVPLDILFTPQYNRFMKELYPLDYHHQDQQHQHQQNHHRQLQSHLLFQPRQRSFDLLSNHQKYTRINHEKLYQRYLDLPAPAPRHLPHDVLQDFITRFALNNNRFVGKGYLLDRKLREDHDTFVRTIIAQNERRREYRKMVQKVFKDLRKSGIEITEQEQVRMMYLSYFKDSAADILSGIDFESPSKTITDEKLGYRKFTFVEYKQIIETIGERSDIYGMLLFLATRHDRFDVIEDILPRVQLGQILGKRNEETDFKMIDSALLNLLNYFTHYIDRKDYVTYLARTIEEIAKLEVANDKIIEHLLKVLTILDVDKNIIDNLRETLEVGENLNETRDMPQEWLYIYTKLKVLCSKKN